MRPFSSCLRRRRASVFLAGAAVWSSPLFAATPVHWLSPVTGKWSDGTKWSSSPTVPDGAGYDVTIAATGANYSVNMDGSFTLHSLTLDSPTCVVNGNSFTSLDVAELNLISGQIIAKNLANARVSVAPSAVLNLNNGAILTNVTLATDVHVTPSSHVALFGPLTIEGGQGLILNATSQGTSNFLRFYGPSELKGAGEIVFDGIEGGYSYVGHGLVPDSTLSIGADLTVRTGTGSGVLGNGSLDRPITNYGTIRSQTADRRLEVHASTFTNHATMTSTAGTLSVNANNFSNLGTMSVTTGATLSVQSTNGSWSNSGTIQATDATVNLLGTWSNSSVISAEGGTVSLSGGWSNTGKLSVNNATVSLGGASTATGSVALTNSVIDITGLYSTAQLTGMNLASSSISLVGGGTVQNTGDTLTIGPAFPLQLKGGTITGGSLRTAPATPLTFLAGATLILNGVSLETTLQVQTGSTLSLTGAWDNNGVIVSDNATISLGGTFTRDKLGTIQRTAGVMRIAGTLDNSATTFTIDPTGTWQLAGGTIIGGTLASTAGASLVTAQTASVSTLDGVMLSANLTVQNLTTLNIQNGLTLSGNTVTLYGGTGNSTMSVIGAQPIGGNGVILLDGVASNGTLRPASSSTLTIGPGIAVQTGTRGGFVGAAGLSTVNQGLISSQTGAQSINLRGNITNQGTIEARNGGTVLLQSANPPATVTNYASGTLTGGTWAAYAGSTLNLGSASITTNAANVILSGGGSQFTAIAPMMANAGTFWVLDGRDFTTAGALSNTGRVVAGVGSDLNVTGNLTLGDDATLAFELLSDLSAEDFGQVAVTGTANLDGRLEVFLAGGHAVQAGDTYTLLTGASALGTFDEVALSAGFTANVIYSPTSVQLQVTAVPEPARCALLALAATALRRWRRVIRSV